MRLKHVDDCKQVISPCRRRALRREPRQRPPTPAEQTVPLRRPLFLALGGCGSRRGVHEVKTPRGDDDEVTARRALDVENHPRERMHNQHKKYEVLFTFTYMKL
jgi:hypothetical protein